jgi:hypothetical protein
VGAPRCNHPAAALRRHARAKAVPTLAHQLARLIRPFHRSFSDWLQSVISTRKSGRLIGEGALARQLRHTGKRDACECCRVELIACSRRNDRLGARDLPTRMRCGRGFQPTLRGILHAQW